MRWPQVQQSKLRMWAQAGLVHRHALGAGVRLDFAWVVGGDVGDLPVVCRAGSRRSGSWAMPLLMAGWF